MGSLVAAAVERAMKRQEVILRALVVIEATSAAPAPGSVPGDSRRGFMSSDGGSARSGHSILDAA